MAMKLTEPAVICTYGPSGIGKTTDNGYSFPRALFAAAPGALNSIRTTCGYEPEQTNNINTIMDATKLIEGVQGTRFSTVVFDDFSFLAEQTFQYLEKERRLSGFKLWGELREATLEFRNKSRYCGITVVLNCWIQPPKVNVAGKKIRGGPKLSGNLPEALPAMCDVVLQAAYEAQRRPWGAVYRCVPEGAYTMKDRFNVATLCDPAPMNLGEIMRAAGYDLPRHPDLPQQEEQVEAIAQKLTGDPTADAELVNTIYAELIRGGVSVPFARWTLRDALDRAVIRRSLDQANSVFIDTKVPLTL
jgi:hypothetical protein